MLEQATKSCKSKHSYQSIFQRTPCTRRDEEPFSRDQAPSQQLPEPPRPGIDAQPSQPHHLHPGVIIASFSIVEQ